MLWKGLGKAESETTWNTLARLADVVTIFGLVPLEMLAILLVIGVVVTVGTPAGRKQLTRLSRRLAVRRPILIDEKSRRVRRIQHPDGGIEQITTIRRRRSARPRRASRRITPKGDAGGAKAGQSGG